MFWARAFAVARSSAAAPKEQIARAAARDRFIRSTSVPEVSVLQGKNARSADAKGRARAQSSVARINPPRCRHAMSPCRTNTQYHDINGTDNKDVISRSSNSGILCAMLSLGFVIFVSAKGGDEDS